MSSDVTEAGLKEMRRRDTLSDQQAAAKPQTAEEKKQQEAADFAFASSQPAVARRSSATISLPPDQNAQRLSPYHRAVLRYLLAHSVAPESAVLAFYKKTSPPSQRNPSLDELHRALNDAVEWASLRVERVSSEYGEERVWMILSRSDVDTALVFARLHE